MTVKTRVLVVDDEAAILRFLKPALEANSYEMTSAGTIAEALKRIAAESPDVVLLDLGLPDGDGKDVIRRAREWSDLPIIVLSAREREAEKIEALDLGADDYVNKPFNVGELMARIRDSRTLVHWKPHFSSTRREAGLLTRAPDISVSCSKSPKAWSIRARTASVAKPRPQ